MKPSVDQTLCDQVRALAHPILSSLGLELVDIEQAAGGRRGLFRVFIDKPGGVTLRDCEQASHYLGHALDAEDAVPYSYTLEVSSPGLDRPLKKIEDYKKAVGKPVRIKVLDAVEGQWVLTGVIRQVGEDAVLLETKPSGTQTVPFANIRQARLEMELKNKKGIRKEKKVHG
jgi:ribosome maturation factor RimP